MDDGRIIELDNSSFSLDKKLGKVENNQNIKYNELGDNNDRGRNNRIFELSSNENKRVEKKENGKTKSNTKEEIKRRFDSYVEESKTKTIEPNEKQKTIDYEIDEVYNDKIRKRFSIGNETTKSREFDNKMGIDISKDTTKNTTNDELSNINKREESAKGQSDSNDRLNIKELDNSSFFD